MKDRDARKEIADMKRDVEVLTAILRKIEVVIKILQDKQKSDHDKINMLMDFMNVELVIPKSEPYLASKASSLSPDDWGL